MRIIRSLLLSLAAVSMPVAAIADDMLTIGSDAPQLDIEHWVQNGNGKFKPVTDFEKDHVYVVEFWATWCGPCVSSMPHLVKLQKEHGDKGVQIISISNEDLETVEKFLEKKYKGGEDGPATYGELTSSYCLTTDPDGSSSETYMQAAGQNGIPCAFVVGKDAKIEWIGHPMQMDEPLQSVLEGKWDREAYKKEMVVKQQAEKKMAELGQMVAQEDYAGALKAIDEILETNDNPQLKLAKFQILVMTKKLDDANTVLAEVLKSGADQPDFVNFVSWNVAQMMSDMDVQHAGLLETATAATEKAVKASEKSAKPAILDTLSHLYLAADKPQKALKTQSRAVELASDDEKADLQEFLDEIKDFLKDDADTDEKVGEDESKDADAPKKK